MRNTLNDIYFGKTKDIIASLRYATTPLFLSICTLVVITMSTVCQEFKTSIHRGEMFMINFILSYMVFPFRSCHFSLFYLYL